MALHGLIHLFGQGALDERSGVTVNEVFDPFFEKRVGDDFFFERENTFSAGFVREANCGFYLVGDFGSLKEERLERHLKGTQKITDAKFHEGHEAAAADHDSE